MPGGRHNPWAHSQQPRSRTACAWKAPWLSGVTFLRVLERTKLAYGTGVAPRERAEVAARCRMRAPRGDGHRCVAQYVDQVAVVVRPVRVFGYPEPLRICRDQAVDVG